MGGQDKCCPVCKEEANEVLIVDDASLPFPPRHRLSGLPGELSFGVRFANATIERECMRLFEYRCRLQHCAHQNVAFGSLKELEQHLWNTHWRQFCHTCLNGRSFRV